MSFIVLLLGILLLVLLITWAKLNAFLSFVIVSILIGLFNGMDVAAVTASLQKVSATCWALSLLYWHWVPCWQACCRQWCSTKISNVLMDAFGRKYLVWALVLTALSLAFPLYNVGFVLMFPLIYAVSNRFDIPAVYIGLPMMAALSVTHGYLPPHPHL